MQRSFLNSLLSCVPVSKRFMRVLALALACSSAFTSRVALSDVVDIDTGPFTDDVTLTNIVFVDPDEFQHYKTAAYYRAAEVLDYSSRLSSSLAGLRDSNDLIIALCSNGITHAESGIDYLVNVEGQDYQSSVLSDLQSCRADFIYTIRFATLRSGNIDSMIATNDAIYASACNVMSAIEATPDFYAGIYATSAPSNSVSGGGSCSCPDYMQVLEEMALRLTQIKLDTDGMLSNLSDISRTLYYSASTLDDFFDYFSSVLDNNFQDLLFRLERFWRYAMPPSGRSLGGLISEYLLSDPWGFNQDLSFTAWLNDSASYFWYCALGLADPSSLDYDDGYGSTTFLFPLHSSVSNLWYTSFSVDTQSARSQVYDAWSNAEPAPDEASSESPLVSCIGLLYRIQHLLTTNMVSRESKEHEKEEDAEEAQDEVEDAANSTITMHSPFDLVHGFVASVDNLDQAIQAVINAIQTTGGLEFVLTDASGITVQLGSDATRVVRSGVVKIVGDSNAGFSRKCLDVLKACFTILWYALAAFLAFSLASWVFRIVWTLGAIAMQCIGGDFSGVVELVHGLGTKFAGEG